MDPSFPTLLSHALNEAPKTQSAIARGLQGLGHRCSPQAITNWKAGTAQPASARVVIDLLRLAGAPLLVRRKVLAAFLSVPESDLASELGFTDQP